MMLSNEDKDLYTKARQEFSKNHSGFLEFHAKFVVFYDAATTILIKKYNLQHKSSFYVLSAIRLFIGKDMNRGFTKTDVSFITGKTKSATGVSIWKLRKAGLIDYLQQGYANIYLISELGIRMLSEFSTIMRDFQLTREIDINRKYIVECKPHHKKNRMVYVPSSDRGSGKSFYSKGKIMHIVYGNQEKTEAAVIWVRIADKREAYPYYPDQVKPINFMGRKGIVRKRNRLKKKEENNG